MTELLTADQKTRAQAILAKDDPTAAAFNAGYDDYPNKSNPFEPDTRPWRFYSHGWQIAKLYAEERERVE